MLIPYILFPLADSNGIIPIDVVITGPTPDPAAATQSIQRLVAKHIKHLYGPWKSRYCDIPYRAW
jgi:Ni,Fe-hydrogenase III small subunit